MVTVRYSEQHNVPVADVERRGEAITTVSLADPQNVTMQMTNFEVYMALDEALCELGFSGSKGYVRFLEEGGLGTLMGLNGGE